MTTSIETLAQMRGPAEGCWPWPGTLDRDGYGRCWDEGRWALAHRAAYERHFGPIPSGLTVDHVCHSADPTCDKGTTCPHRRCVNPAHLEAVTHEENCRRRANRATCRQGHPLDERNLHVDSKGRRSCRRCAVRRTTEYKRRTRADRQEKKP